MGYERIWERLIEYLAELGSAREVPDGVEVTIERPPGRSRTVEVVMSPEDWDDYLSIMYGDGDPAATTIKDCVLATPDGVRFLVYDGTYDWTPSETRELPPEEPEDLGPGQGQWVTIDDAGNVTSRFADWDEQDGDRPGPSQRG
ncbi:hypothetical protein [Nocardioides sp. zg-DK7169]|uniref:hypothetical protein n=1 Tax=Nocardioides sp. zg-DK7169 TaxID=2736600 RepID=UPI0015528C1E|nr:hypothetical protein [Nocardioides sp. zg-DK7169]NPC97472.1 hypothetical protein [Nocardioides sp. zg-DK7169]